MTSPAEPRGSLLAVHRDMLDRLEARRRSLQRAGKPHDRVDAEIAALAREAGAAVAARRARHAALAHPAFDDALPIAERRAEIAALIAAHQVVIVCGETGSGKTTQLPKICLELGRGLTGMIGCTQPRRIAARSLASRLAKELGATGAHAVGYKIRFNDHTDENTLVKVMTDGILLAETHADRLLNAYDTLIIDEAHERSLNIDFLLGYVKQLTAKRPDLKVIVTSATIDPQRFSRHFALSPGPSPAGGRGEGAVEGAPIIEVSGRTYPVEVRYRPEHFLDDAEDAVPVEDAVVKAIDEIFAETRDGDVLVFLPGEREIRDCDEALRKHHPNATEVLPLYSRLSNAEQDRVFHPGGRRRIVLATNVAETSLTVPGIRYVVDAGVARINRYSPRSKINQLQIEPISQASARQRAGRCGRVAAGIAVRLYSEEDFNARPEFTTPEILRTSLADVILRMKSLGLGDVQDFPFVEPPSPRMIEDGYRQLFELNAVDGEKNLTALGWKLAKFPVDPAIARMLVAGEREAALKEVLIIAAALSVQDPRLRPHDKQQEAALAHEKFAHPQSEFLAFVKLWEYYEDAWKHKKSNRKFEQQLSAQFLSPLRMREWRDVHAQLSELVAAQGMHLNAEPAKYDALHRALLTGLITNVGTKAIEGDHYLGTRGLKFQLPRRAQQHAQQKATRMKWVMAAELTETTRVYARTVASIEPEWVEALADHLVTRTWFEPHWERKSGQVVAFEQVSLYGLVVNPKKRVHYGAINPVEAREIFIRQGLVPGEVDTRGKFLAHNQRLIGDIEDIEAKARRQDVLVDEEDMFALYDAIIPADIVNLAGFEKWRKDAERANPGLLEFTPEQYMRRWAQEITFELFPKSLRHRGAVFPLAYRFEPGHPMDGVTVALPVAVLNQVVPARFEWLVMGMLRDKAAALLKSLPQRFRSQLVPLPETVSEWIGHATRREGMQDLSAAETPLIDALSAWLAATRRMEVPAGEWDLARLPPHLFMNFRIVDADGKELAMSRDFAALKSQFADASRTVFSTLHRNRLERDGLTRWDIEDLPATINFERNQIRYDGFPALVDNGTSVSIKIFDEADAAREAHRRGVTRLFMLEMPEQVKFTERGIKFSPVAAFEYAHFFPQSKNHTQEEMRAELAFAAFAGTFTDAAGEIRDGEAFNKARVAGKPALAANAQALTRAMEEAFTLSAEARKLMKERYVATWEHIGPDITDQLDHLFAPDFLRDLPMAQLLHFPRYLKAVVLRLNKARQGSMERDLEHTRAVKPLWQNAQKLPDWLTPAAAEYRWMIEELRVSLFAQELRTPQPVSVKRLGKLWEDLNASP